VSFLIPIFTWVGVAVCLCGMLLILFWIIDHTARRFLRELRWWKAFVRFLWLEAGKKEALRDEAERIRKEHS